MEAFYIISFLISIILSIGVLITFFSMAGNLRTIRVLLERQQSEQAQPNIQSYRTQYYTHLALGDKNAASQDLLNIVFAQALSPNIEAKNRPAKWEELKKVYEHRFEAIEAHFPEYPF